MFVLTALGCIVAAVVAGVAALLVVDVIREKKRAAYVKQKGYKEAPEVPGRKPVLGHLPELAKLPEHNRLPAFAAKVMEELGPTFQFQAPLGQRVLVTVEPEVIKHFISGPKFNDGVYTKGAAYKVQYMEMFGDGIFNTDGEQWMWHRNLASSLFQIQYLKSYVDIFHKNAKGLFAKLEELKDRPEGIDMQDYYMRYTLDSFAEIGFGVELNSMDQEVNKFALAFDVVQTWSARRARLGPLWRLKEKISVPTEFAESVQYLDDFVYRIIKGRQQVASEELTDKTDLLSRLVLLQRDDPQNFTDRRVRDFVINFLLAGRDTTASLLTFASYQVSQHPEVEKKMVEEMNRVIGEDKEFIPTWKNQKDLRYVTQILKETLRLHPPVPLDGYTAQEDDILPGGYYVSKGTMVLYSCYAMHRRKDLFGDNVEEFDPDRFEETPVPFSFLPFHGGPRVCLGQEMAYLEAKIMLCNIFRKYSLKLHEGHEVKEKAALLLTALGGMPMHVIPRN